MAGRKKLPKGKVRREILQFRYPEKETKEIDELCKKYGFKDKSKFCRFSVDLAKQILQGDSRFVETIFNQFPRPEDPKQLDIFEQMQIQAKAEVYTRMSEAMREVPDSLKAVVAQHVEL